MLQWYNQSINEKQNTEIKIKSKISSRRDRNQL